MSLKKLISGLKRLLNRKEKRELLFLFVIMLFSAMLEVVGIGVVPIVLNFAFNPEDLSRFPDLYQWLGDKDWLDPNTLYILGSSLIILVFLVKTAFKIFVDYNQIEWVKRKQIDLSNQLFSKYIKGPYKNHLNINSAELIRNIQNEVSYICSKLLIPMLLMILSLFTVLLVVVSMAAIEPVVTGFLILFVGGAVLVFNKLIRARQSSYGLKMQEFRKVQLSFLFQGINNIKSIKVSRKENFFANQFFEITKAFSNIQSKSLLLNKIPTSYLELVSIFAILASVLYLNYTLEDSSAITTIMAFIVLSLVRLRSYFSQIMSSSNLIMAYKSSVTPVLNDLESVDWESRHTKKPEISHFSSLEVSEVSFEYADGTVALDEVSCKIVKGNIVGIAGESGSGKSTFVDVLLGLLKPGSGAMILNGNHNVQDELDSWYELVGYVPQSISLIDSTIKENIALGIHLDDIDDDQVAKVLELAQLSGFIDSLENGLLTEVGENGVKLSGGQKQRIGLARALYRKPTVMILDEATSALDNLTEEKVIEALCDDSLNLTLVMIAHRLSTLRNCDKILIFDKGKIIETDSYSQMVEHSDFFKKFIAASNSNV